MSKKSKSRPSRRAPLLVLALAGILPALPASGQTPASWVTATSGTWTDPTKWSTNPVYPHTSFGGSSYDTTISAPGSYTVTFNQSLDVHSLALNAASLTFFHSAGQLNVPGGINIQQGLYLLQGGSISSTGTIQVGSSGTFSAQWGEISGATLSGTILGGTSGKALTLSSNWQNLGTIQFQGGTLNLAGNWNNAAGTIIFSGDQLNFGGKVDLTKIGTFIRNSGSVALTGTFNNANTTADLTTAIGPWAASGSATIIGGSIVAPVVGQPLQVTGGFVKIDGSTIDTDISVTPGATLTLAGGWTNNRIITANSATVQLGGTFAQSNIGSIIASDYYITGTLNNSGTSLNLNPSMATFHVTDGGQIIGGSINTTGGASLYAGKSSSLASLTLNGLLTLETGAGVRLANVTNNGSIVMSNASSIDSFSPVTNYGTISANSAKVVFGDGWANNGTIALSNGTLIMNLHSGSFSNAGTISGNGAIYYEGAWSTSEMGNLNRTGGAVYMTGTIDNAGRTLLIDNVGTWTLAAITSHPSPPGISGGTIASVNGGVLRVGEVAYNQSPEIYPNGAMSGVKLDTNVLVAQSSSLIVRNGIELMHGSQIRLVETSTGTPTRIVFEGAQTVSGNGEILFDMVQGPQYSSFLYDTSGTLTLGSGITVRTAAGGGIVGLPGMKIVNQGTISSQTTGRQIQISGTFENQGVVQALNGGSITLETLDNQGTIHTATGSTVYLPAAGSLSNYNNGTLTGGTWWIEAGSTIDFGTATINVNKGTVILDGVNSIFSPINWLQTNRGTFTLAHGRSFVQLAPMANLGTMNIGDDSKLSVRLQLNNVRTIDLNGTLVIDYNTVSPLGTFASQIGNHIFSSEILTDPSKAIGYTDNGDIVTLALTFAGDANLDKVVDIRDLYQLASHWQTPANWQNGDFNYDGIVNAKDLGILANNWQAGNAGGAGSAALDNAILASLGLPQVSVPEPGLSIAVLAIGATFMARRRSALHSIADSITVQDC